MIQILWGRINCFGVPYDSILAPLLFNMFLADFLSVNVSLKDTHVCTYPWIVYITLNISATLV